MKFKFKQIHRYLKGVGDKISLKIKGDKRSKMEIITLIIFFILIIVYFYNKKSSYLHILGHSSNYVKMIIPIFFLFIFLRFTYLKNISRGEFLSLCGIIFLILFFLFENTSHEIQLFKKKVDEENVIDVVNSYNCYIASSTINKFSSPFGSPWVDSYITNAYEENLDVIYRIYLIKGLKNFIPILGEMHSSNSLAKIKQELDIDMGGSKERNKEFEVLEDYAVQEILFHAENIYNFLCKQKIDGPTN
jgi:hypothetical protein